MSTPTAKVIVIGEAGVGKTSIARRFFQKTFDQEQKATVGSGYFRDIVRSEGQEVELEVWDTAGAEKYRSLTPIYFTGASVAIIVYDITSKLSFDELDSFVAMLERAPNGILLYLVGNKIDLESDRKVSYSEGSQYSEKVKAEMFLEVSALSGEGIVDLFVSIAGNHKLSYLNYKPDISVSTANVRDEEEKEKSCC